jgi:hypothetical protein
MGGASSATDYLIRGVVGFVFGKGKGGESLKEH